MKKTVLVDSNSSKTMFVERLSLKPEQSGTVNNKNDLFYYVVSGYGLMSVEAYGYTLEQEASVYVPKGSEYTFTNTGDVELAIVCYGVQ